MLFPIHFQPEASTLVQAPMYLDQLALLRDIAKALPIGHRLCYWKRTLSHWSLSTSSLTKCASVGAIPAARLRLDEPTWPLIPAG